MTKKIDLQVNGNPIVLDYFVQSFVHHTTRGMIESLENVEPIKHLILTVKGDDVEIQLNGKPVSANKFVSRIAKSTISGMVAPLKGVNGPLTRAKIEIEE